MLTIWRSVARFARQHGGTRLCPGVGKGDTLASSVLRSSWNKTGSVCPANDNHSPATGPALMSLVAGGNSNSRPPGYEPDELPAAPPGVVDFRSIRDTYGARKNRYSKPRQAEQGRMECGGLSERTNPLHSCKGKQRNQLFLILCLSGGRLSCLVNERQPRFDTPNAYRCAA